MFSKHSHLEGYVVGVEVSGQVCVEMFLKRSPLKGDVARIEIGVEVGVQVGIGMILK